MSRNWEQAYRAAVLETDSHKLADKIDLAVDSADRVFAGSEFFT